MIRLTRGVLILIGLLAMLNGMASARQETVATLLVAEGSATVTPADGDPQEYMRDDVAVVNMGDQIAISDDGEGLLTFFEGAETRLAAGTVVEVQAYQVEEDKTEIGLSLTRGQAMSNVETMVDAESRFEVNTPAATITVRGTQFVIFVRPNELTQVATLDGLVAVSALDQTVEVPCGYGVKVVPGEAPGTVNVWGQLTLAVSAPEDIETDNLPVVLTNTDNGQLFYYRSGDLMTAVLGPYELLLDTPGPVRIPDILFPPDTTHEERLELETALGALVLNVGETDLAEDDHLLVRFEQDDLVGETVTAPGEPILAGPGTWTVEVRLESDPEKVNRQEITIEAGETLTLDLDANDFRDE